MSKYRIANSYFYRVKVNKCGRIIVIMYYPNNTGHMIMSVQDFLADRYWDGISNTIGQAYDLEIISGKI